MVGMLTLGQIYLTSSEGAQILADQDMTNMNQAKCSSGSTKVAEGMGKQELVGTRCQVSGVRVDAIRSRQPRQQGCKGNS